MANLIVSLVRSRLPKFLRHRCCSVSDGLVSAGGLAGVWVKTSEVSVCEPLGYGVQTSEVTAA